MLYQEVMLLSLCRQGFSGFLCVSGEEHEFSGGNVIFYVCLHVKATDSEHQQLNACGGGGGHSCAPHLSTKSCRVFENFQLYTAKNEAMLSV